MIKPTHPIQRVETKGVPMPCNCCEMENNTFGEDEAKSNLKDYRKRGPANQTKLILEAVRSLGLKKG